LETLRAAKRILGPDAERILRGFLKDPEIDLRKRALRALGDINGTSAIPDLKAQLDSETLPDLDPQEMGELLRAYARVGGDEAVRDLVDLARRASFFKRGRWQPVRMAAIRSLAAARGPSALRALDSFVLDSNEEIARAARAAMTARERSQESDSGSDDDGENEDES
jgi:HEAT repeat protein